MLEYLLEIQNLKNVKRYAKHDKIYSESVTDHSFMVAFMALELLEKLKLNLDAIKVVKLCLIHDLGELGLDSDYDACSTKSDKLIKQEKEEYENKKIKELKERFNQSNLLELTEDYQTQTSLEAKFVKAIDKLETTLHELNRGVKYFNDPDFAVVYCNEAVNNFPSLKPFYEEIKKYMKEEFKKANMEWKEEIGSID